MARANAKHQRLVFAVKRLTCGARGRGGTDEFWAASASC